MTNLDKATIIMQSQLDQDIQLIRRIMSSATAEVREAMVEGFQDLTDMAEYGKEFKMIVEVLVRIGFCTATMQEADAQRNEKESDTETSE